MKTCTTCGVNDIENDEPFEMCDDCIVDVIRWLQESDETYRKRLQERFLAEVASERNIRYGLGFVG